MPQRDPYSSKDPYEPLYRQIKALNERVQSLENKSIPTVPFYDPTNYPQDSVEGQVAIGTDDVHRWFSHGEWHQANGATMPWLLLQGGSLNGLTIPGGGVTNDYYFDMSGLLTSPLNGGGTIDSSVYAGITTDDSEVDIETDGSSNEPFSAIKFRSPGLYMCKAVLGWFTDWGPVRLNYSSSHDDSDFSFLVWDLFLMRTDNTMLAVPPTTKLVHSPTTTHNQYAVEFLIMFHIDPRAVNPQMKFYAVSDNAHTWNNTDSVGQFSAWFVRLSPSGVSNPDGNHGGSGDLGGGTHDGTDTGEFSVYITAE